jgi:hypothetical protein
MGFVLRSQRAITYREVYSLICWSALSIQLPGQQHKV